MELIASIFGDDSNLTAGQMAARAAVIFFITLALIRVSGRRSFGQRTPFDATTTVLLGAVLSAPWSALRLSGPPWPPLRSWFYCIA